jgi:hypothetical protein
MGDEKTSERDVVHGIISGDYTRPVKVVAYDIEERWARDVTEDIARAIVVEGWPLHWKDSFGTVHACEQTESSGTRVAWTICGKDVTDNAVYVAERFDEVTCAKCERYRWESIDVELAILR